MSAISSRIWRLLVSRRVAIVLLSLVLGLLMAGSLLPSPKFMTPAQREAAIQDTPVLYSLGERFNSYDLATGYFFGFIGVFLVISTAMCSVDRIAGFIRERRRSGASPTAPEQTAPGISIASVSHEGEVLSAELGGLGADEARVSILRWLKKGRFRIQYGNSAPQGMDALQGMGGDDSECITGRRGHVGFWGSVFFHLVLITALVGLVMYYLGAFRGTLLFIEGQSYELTPSVFRYVDKQPLWGLRLPRAELALIQQYSIFAPNDPFYATDRVARFRVTDLDDGGVRDVEVCINNPLVIDGRDFLLTMGGFSPYIVITSAGGGVVLDSYVSLRNENGVRDSVTLEDGTLEVLITLYPDYLNVNGEYGTRGLEPKNPFVRLSVIKGGEFVFQGVIPRGGHATGGGYEFSFPDLHKWVTLQMVDEPGMGFFFVLSFFGLAGLALRMLDPEEIVHVELSPLEHGVRIKMRLMSRHYPGLLNQRAQEFISALEPAAEGAVTDTDIV